MALQKSCSSSPKSVHTYIFDGRRHDTEFKRVIKKLHPELFHSDAKKGHFFTLGISHGDFAAYNILHTERGVAAIDWEMIRVGKNVLYDVVYYYIMLKVYFFVN